MTESGVIQGSLEDFVRGYSPEQAHAWEQSIPMLQREAGELLDRRIEARGYGAILEYELPYDGRRPDVIVLAGGAVVVLELKGKEVPSRADLDQAAGYARDLRAYHRECQDRVVCAVVVPTLAKGTREVIDGIVVAAPDRLDELAAECAAGAQGITPTLAEFLSDRAYSPLPTLVQAARELFHSRTLRDVWRARATTDPAVDAIAAIAHEAARTRTRHLVLVTGVPGAGKTLVGMRAVHAHHLDDLAVARDGKKPTVPGLYLTGNGPLAEVLQYELRKAGGGGATFVRHIKSYLDRYGPHPERVPPEHLLVFDEAQRAFSPDMVADKHPDWPLALLASEPELFVRVCDRMPEWAVLVGLIGGGQEIHVGEEEGLVQWRHALERSKERWSIHAPASLEPLFVGSTLPTHWLPALNLNTEIRFHGATFLHEFVDLLLKSDDPAAAGQVMERARAPYGGRDSGLRLYLTRDLEAARGYLHERYAEAPEARYGLVASSRDRSLGAFGIGNDFNATKSVRIGPWFTEGDPDGRTCRHLDKVVTEFQCQGLELDMALLAWGTDLRREGGRWSDAKARRYRPNGRTRARDPLQMRVNAYRVLLTRGRDGTIVFVPALGELDETWQFLRASGFREL
jgi:hypothetical protein